MRVDEHPSFDDYWIDPRFRVKRPIRNGSRAMQVGDNIYHRAFESESWIQEDSHHSLPIGLPNSHNVDNDTQTNRVLISSHYIYFGDQAPEVPISILSTLGYRNGRSHRVFPLEICSPLFAWLENNFGRDFGSILGDPFDFIHSSRRYSVRGNKVT